MSMPKRYVQNPGVDTCVHNTTICDDVMARQVRQTRDEHWLYTLTSAHY